MHLRGKGMSMEAIYPDGRREMLSQVTDFNFNWHNMYIYDDDVAPLLPKGTILHLLAWYDNTKANKSNPDPDQWVGWGDRTVDEMGHAWLNITYYNDDRVQDGSRGARREDGPRRRRRIASSSNVGRRIRESLKAPSGCRAAPFSSAVPLESYGMRAGHIGLARSAWLVVRGRDARLRRQPRAAAGVGQTPSSLPLTAPIRERGIQRDAGVRRLVLRQGRRAAPAGRLLQPQHQAGIRHPGRDRTTASSPADPIRGSRRTSTPAGSGACSRSSCRRISATRS